MNSALEELKAKRAPTSLATLLEIYSKAEHLCYVDFMAGAKALVKFMAPIEIPIISSHIRLPDLLGGYVASELSKIMAPHSIVSHEHQLKFASKEGMFIRKPKIPEGATEHEIEIAICWIMMTEVFPKLQAQWERESAGQENYSSSLGMGTGTNYE